MHTLASSRLNPIQQPLPVSWRDTCPNLSPVHLVLKNFPDLCFNKVAFNLSPSIIVMLIKVFLVYKPYPVQFLSDSIQIILILFSFSFSLVFLLLSISVTNFLSLILRIQNVSKLLSRLMEKTHTHSHTHLFTSITPMIISRQSGNLEFSHQRL